MSVASLNFLSIPSNLKHSIVLFLGVPMSTHIHKEFSI